MGMDISGKNPINKKGEYIRFGAFSWPNYINFAELVAPEQFSLIEYPYTNDGSGLDAENAKIMGEKILKAINSPIGVEYIESIPERATSFSLSINGGIEASNYRKLCEPERLIEFGEFLINCGGFEIW